MRYNQLGMTGLNISAIGFGASTLGNVFGNVSYEEGQKAVRHAVSRGVTFFDVSPYYGLTEAENRLGSALEGHREDIVLATKCGRYGTDKFDFSAETITLEFENSLRRLKTDRVEVLQAHDIEFADVDQIIHETIPAMRRLQEQGKTRFVGITSYWPDLLVRVAQQVPVDTVLNYCHSNLMMDDMDNELTPFCGRKHTGLINASPLHMGLLGGQIPPMWHPAPIEVKVAAADVAAICRSFGCDPALVALSACLRKPVVASTLIGIANVEQVETSCAALDFVPPPELIAAIRQRVLPVYNKVWSSGRVENQDHA